MAVVAYSGYIIWYPISWFAVVLGIKYLHWLHRGCFIFPESDLMTTLFWYYRPEEITGTSTTFQKDELLASQHYDDNSVACIEEKCSVLGMTQYCRYCTELKRTKEHVDIQDSFSIIQDGPTEFPQPILDVSITPNSSDHQMFFCYRGYNHTLDKLLKIQNH